MCGRLIVRTVRALRAGLLLPSNPLTERSGLCTGAFPELYDKVKPEVDVVTIGKQMADVIM